jgi:hypothetical protein
MRRWPTTAGVALAIIVLSLAGLVRPVDAGEVTACFLAGDRATADRPVPQHETFNSLVAEFVNPQNTGIGRSLSRMFWRELQQSVEDLDGAEVMLAQESDDELRQTLYGRHYLDDLGSGYHEAALGLDRSLGVQMSLWGVALEAQDDVFAQSFLTFLPAQEDPWTLLRVTGRDTTGFELSAPVGHGRLNFAALDTHRRQLFAGGLTARCPPDAECPEGVPLHAGPSNGAPIVGHVPVGRSLQAFDMFERWFRVTTGQGETAFIDMRHLEIAPRSLHTTPRTNVHIRPAPGSSRTYGLADLSGDYDVLDVGKDARGRDWYRIDAGGKRGWVAGWLFAPNFTFPAVHFVEGLHRYARHDHDGAIAALERFVARGAQESNVTRSVAHQFLAAALLTRDACDPADALEPALAHLDAAVALTPFDPDVYALRALVRLGSLNDLERSVGELEDAFELDARNIASRDLLREMDEIIQRNGIETLTPGLPVAPEVKTRIERLRRRFLRYYIIDGNPPWEPGGGPEIGGKKSKGGPPPEGPDGGQGKAPNAGRGNGPEGKPDNDPGRSGGRNKGGD